MTKASHALALCLFFLGAANVIAKPGDEEAVTGRILSYGLYDLQGEEEILPAPDAAAGTTLVVEDYLHLATTTEVPLELGVSFGFKYELHGMQALLHDEIMIRALHPPMEGVDGRTYTESAAMSEVEPDRGRVEGILTYRLSEARELVAGRWTLQVLHQGKLLVSKEFTVR